MTGLPIPAKTHAEGAIAFQLCVRLCPCESPKNCTKRGRPRLPTPARRRKSGLAFEPLGAKSAKAERASFCTRSGKLFFSGFNLLSRSAQKRVGRARGMGGNSPKPRDAATEDEGFSLRLERFRIAVENGLAKRFWRYFPRECADFLVARRRACRQAHPNHSDTASDTPHPHR